jgi:O-antigen/teichoic acid export membrane protein
MKWTLGSVLAAIVVLIGILFMILRKGVIGAGIILVGMGVLLFVVTFVSELVKLHGKKVQGRDRHP